MGHLGNIDSAPKGLSFLGTPEDFIQVATFRYEYGHEMNSHAHIPRTPPETFITHEVLIVWKGIVELKVYDNSFEQVFYHIMEAGDFYVNVGGGVGYKVFEDNTIMLEAKTGPFPGPELDRVLI